MMSYGPGSLRPRLAVELDDDSHERTDRQQRDAFADSVFAAAELSLGSCGLRLHPGPSGHTQGLRAVARWSSPCDNRLHSFVASSIPLYGGRLIC